MNPNTPPYTTLVNACELFGCSLDHLLRLGLDREFPMYIRVPDDLAIFNVGAWDLQNKSDADVGSQRPKEPLRTPDVQFLQLLPVDCEEILKNGMSLARRFPASGVLHHGCLRSSVPSALEPYRDKAMEFRYAGVRNSERSFAAYRPSVRSCDWQTMMQPRPIEVTAESILISRMEMLKLFDVMKIVPSEVLGGVQLKRQPHISDRLYALYEVYDEVWGQGIPVGFKRLSESEFFDRLRKKEFSKNLASCGAFVLNDVTLETTTNGKQRIIADCLKALISCASVFWLPTPTNPQPNPRSEDIAAWLEEYCEVLPKHRREAAASIIRPSSAPKGRKPESSD
jgi:hypothetical protein